MHMRTVASVGLPRPEFRVSFPVVGSGRNETSTRAPLRAPDFRFLDARLAGRVHFAFGSFRIGGNARSEESLRNGIRFAANLGRDEVVEVLEGEIDTREVEGSDVGGEQDDDDDGDGDGDDSGKNIQVEESAHDDEEGDEENDDEEEDDDVGSDEGTEGAELKMEGIEEESLRTLEWNTICFQVSRFCSSSLAMEICLAGKLPIPNTREGSETLLRQTAAALSLPFRLQFGTVCNISYILRCAQEYEFLEISSLCSIKETLKIAKQLHEYLLLDKSSPLLALMEIMNDCNLCDPLNESLTRCIDERLRYVRDDASLELSKIREQRRSNARELEQKLQKVARMIYESGWSDSPNVFLRRGRLCVGVKANHKAKIDFNHIVLDSSNTKSTVYIEPLDCVDKNNLDKELGFREEEEEKNVLIMLTQSVSEMHDSLLDLQDRILAVDLACARAGHAQWMNATCPVFVQTDNGVGVEDPDTSGASSRSKILDEPPSQAKSKEFEILNSTQGNNSQDLIKQSVDDQDNTNDAYIDHTIPVMQLLRVVHPILISPFLSPLPTSPLNQNNPRVPSSNNSQIVKRYENEIDNQVTVVPVDIEISGDTKVVCISGSNTGGKTAILKTIGICSLMAKAGLFLPTQPGACLPWFDKVLVDVGDEQSLEQNLSTFSGHIQRLKRILEDSTHQSLLLLDEVGSGTDPSEGAIFASSILFHAVDAVKLVITTTHYAQLKTLKEKDRRFENASVGFDPKTFKPTYQIFWGKSGQSNALDIAESLHVDKEIVDNARRLASDMAKISLIERSRVPGEIETGGSSALIDSLMDQLTLQEMRYSLARQTLDQAKGIHTELTSEVFELPLREKYLVKVEKGKADLDYTQARKAIESIVDSFRSQCFDSSTEKEKIEDLLQSTLDSLSTVLDDFTYVHSPSTDSASTSNGTESQSQKWQPSIGDRVIVRRLGKSVATVVQIHSSNDETFDCEVMLGSIRMRVNKEEIQSLPSSSPPASKNEKKIQASTNLFASQEVPIMFDAAIQTPQNTLDLRGMSVEEALFLLNNAIAMRKRGNVLFVIHGLGTLKIKNAVIDVLKRHSLVAKYEQEGVLNPGCTVVYVK